MQHKTRKYTGHHIQNELLKILALGHLSDIASSITGSGYFTLECGEVTDTSNKKQVIVFLRWVDKFEAHKDFIGPKRMQYVKGSHKYYTYTTTMIFQCTIQDGHKQ